ncbi:hypothetical protein ACH9L7_19775 (plasmid) [Haloferax sp. S1W]|uniref:hypothetical protein n=1 Tax=Haloferax sp. S1W TaxID=3377110 RepID=UPI0037C8CAB8
MTAASMVEEVGAYTIKELEVDADPDMGDTRLSDVLNWISAYDLVPDEVDLAVLEDDLRSARNELAHSMMARSTTITIDSFGDYVDAVWSAINLTNYLAERLLGGVFTELDALSFTVPR